jgi:plastocyanin
MDNSKKVLVLAVVVLAIAVVGLVATRSSAPVEKVQEVEVKTEAPNPMQAQVPSALTDEQKAELKAGAEAHEPKDLTFHITAGSFYFTPNEIKVKQGDKVKIILTNVLGTHNLMFVDFGGMETRTIKGGESDAIEFTTDKKGTFEFYCGVGNGYHRMMGQIGVLLVE